MDANDEIRETASLEEQSRAANIKRLTTLATALGGAASTALLTATLLPEIATVLAASAVGLLAGFLAKYLDVKTERE